MALRGWNAIGVDYQISLLEKAHELAHTYGTTITTHCVDVEGPQAPQFFAEYEDQLDLVNVSRYLNRQLFPTLKYVSIISFNVHFR